MENPYEAPSVGPLVDDRLQRPMGVSILSVLTAILGLVLLAALITLAVDWEETKEFAAGRRIPPPLYWGVTGLAALLAFVAAVGMWRGCKWGWWIACSGFVFYVVQNFASAAMANLSGGAPSIETFMSVDSIKYVLRALFFTAVLAYWLRTRVRKYFRVEQTGRIKAIALAAAGGIGIITLITVVMFIILRYGPR
jgi:hypothetical protein